MSYLYDCASKDPARTEMFIVQSDFGGVTKEMRDRMTQAVLPISHSIIKIKRARLDLVLDCEEVKSMISALGIGICLRRGDDGFDLAKLRYGKVILVMDGTDEGQFIRDQVLAFFYRFMRPLLRDGHVFLVPACRSGKLDEQEFAATAMLPEFRQLVPVLAGKNFAKTLSLAAFVKS